MKTKKFLIFSLSVLLCISSFAFTLSVIPAFALEKAITISGESYDEETGLLTYVKASYSSNTSDGVSFDSAEYLYIPCAYEGSYTDSTSVSIKYVNSGVEFMPMYIEYGPGINAGGVDYPAGTEYICVNGLSSADSWNATFSKSVDGYNVLTVRFGNYASGVHDIVLRGFRLYLDYGKEVSSARSFEVLGCTVHEAGTTPSFASDPKGCRLSKLTAEGTQLVDNACLIDGTATLNASILDYSAEFKKLNFAFTVDQTVNLAILLDGEEESIAQYGVGSHKISVDFTKSSYSSLQIVVTGENCNLKINALDLVATPYVGELAGTNFTVTKAGEQTTVKYTFKTAWHNLSAPIRQYNADYDCLLIEFTCDKPIVLGIMIDDVYLYSHWEHTTPLEVGAHSFFFELGDMVSAESSLVIYLDPSITGYTGTEGEKTVVFTNIEFKDSKQMQKATINVAPSFEFDYDGEPKQATGATSNSGESLIYEYKPSYADENAYDTDMPVDAGEYDVRVVSPLNMTYATTYAYSKLIINKIAPPTPTKQSVNVDYALSKVFYDAEIFAVSVSEEFSYVLPSGAGVLYGDTLYVKYVESTNYYESEAISFTLDKKEGDVEVTVNVQRETTSQVIGEDCEYSKDGLNWTVGQGKRVMLEPGNIYLFRKRATSSSFAGKITYIAIPYRAQAPSAPELVETDSHSITVKEIAGAEYRLSDTVWQDSAYFDYLQEGMVVTVYVRIKGANGVYASEEVSATFTVGKTPENSSVVDNSGNEQSKGCESSLFGSNLIALLFASCALLVYKNKKGGK